MQPKKIGMLKDVIMMNEVLDMAEALWTGKTTTYEHHPFSLPYGIAELTPKTWMHK